VGKVEKKSAEQRDGRGFGQEKGARFGWSKRHLAGMMESIRLDLRKLYGGELKGTTLQEKNQEGKREYRTQRSRRSPEIRAFPRRKKQMSKPPHTCFNCLKSDRKGGKKRRGQKGLEGREGKKVESMFAMKKTRGHEGPSAYVWEEQGEGKCGRGGLERATKSAEPGRKKGFWD